MTKLSAYLIAACSTLALCACTHVATTPDNYRSGAYHAPDTNGALKGVSYSLPMLQYDIGITRSLARCPTRYELELSPGQKVDVLNHEALAFATKVEAKPGYVPGEQYLVDYSALQSWFKTTGFSVEPYPSGALKAINLSADDKTGEIVKDLISVGLTVASVGLGVPLPFASTPPPPPPVSIPFESEVPGLSLAAAGAALRQRGVRMVECTAEAVQKLDAVANSLNSEKAQAEKLPALTKDVEKWTLVAGLRAAEHADALSLAGALDAQNAALLLSSTEQKKRTDLEAETSATAKLAWPRLPEQLEQVQEIDAGQLSKLSALLQVSVDRMNSFEDIRSWLDAEGAPHAAAVRARPANAAFFKAYDAWVKEKVLQEAQRQVLGCSRQVSSERTECTALRDVAACKPSAADVGLCIRDSTRVLSRIEAAKIGFPWCEEPDADKNRCLRQADTKLVTRAEDGKADAGIFVRPPIAGTFKACLATREEDDNKRYACRSSLLDQPNASVPQLGQLRFLPFRSRPFESAEMALSLREDGSIEKFEFKNPKAMGAGIAAAAANAASQYEAAITKQATARKSTRDEEVALVQHQLDLATKKEALLKAQTPATPTEKEILTKEVEKAELEVRYLQALLARKKAEADLTAAAAGGGA
jgi:hypothetical protein